VSNVVFEKIRTFITEGGAKTGQEIMDHMNMNSPAARAILRDMITQNLLVHRKGLYYLQGQEKVKGTTMVEAMNRNDKRSEDDTKKVDVGKE
jgi:predicted transcriptional regulator